MTIPYGYCQCGCGKETRLATQNDIAKGWIKGKPLRFLRGHYAKSQALPDEERFWSKVAKSEDPDKCWEWQGNLQHKGYGSFSYKRKPYGAHRFVWEITYGEIPKGLFVCHHCDNPRCVNPSHLFLGTPLDNMRDMINKGRLVAHKGEQNAGHKLTTEDVLYIREQIAMDKTTRADLAREMNIHKHTIDAIVARRSWKHLA